MTNLDLALTIRAVDQMTAPMRRMTQQVGGAFSRLNAKLAQTQSAMIGLGSATFIGDALSQTGRKAFSALSGPVKAAASFEQAMASVGAVTRAGTQDQAKLTAQARSLGATTSFSAGQAADGMRFLGMAGFNTRQIMEGMPSVLSLARAGMIDLGQAADIGSNILSGFGLQADQMTRIADVMTAVTTRANVNMAELGETMKYVAPIAKNLGIPLEDAAAAAGLLGNVGIKGSMAGTTLRAAMQRLAAPTGAASKMLGNFGIAVKDESGNLRPFVKILEELAAVTEGMGTADRTDLLKQIFDAEAAAGMAELMEKAGGDQLSNFADALRHVKGEADRVSTAMDNTAEGGFRALSSAVEGLQISFGNLLIPAANTATKALRALTAWVNEFVVGWPILSQIVGYLAAGVGLLAIAGGAVIKTLAGIWGAALILKPILSTFGVFKLTTGLFGLSKILFSLAGAALPALIGAIKAMGIALLTTPVGWVIAAIAAIAGAAYLIWEHWEPISKWLSDVFEGIKANWSLFTDWIGGWVDDTFGWIDRIGAAISGIFDIFGGDEAVVNLPPPSGYPGGVSDSTAIKAAGGSTTAQAGGNSTSNATINIQQQPGEDSEALAQRILRVLDQESQTQLAGSF